MSATIAVDPEVYEAASAVFGIDLAGLVEDGARRFASKAATVRRVAGSSDEAQAWAKKYDAAADAALATIDEFRRASVTVGLLLQQSGFNHARAEAHSDVSGKVPLPPDETDYDPHEGAPFSVPPVAGGTFHLDGVLGQLQELIEVAWPDGNADKIRALGTAWGQLGSHLQAGYQLVADGIATISSQVSPEVEDACLVCRGLGDQLDPIVTQCFALGGACDDFATAIDTAHAALIKEVVGFIEVSEIIEVGGVLLGDFFGPEALGAAQAPEALTAVRVIRAVVRIGQEFDAAMTAAAERIVARVLGTADTALKVIVSRIPLVSESTPVAEGVAALQDASAAVVQTVWKEGPTTRGFLIEARLGGNLPRSFPTVDKWDRAIGEVTSIKSIDLTANSYQEMKRLKSLLQRYVDKVANFHGAYFDKFRIMDSQITTRILELAIPAGSTSVEQAAVLKDLSQYAQQNGVRLVIQEVS